jgi:HEAT repeat protein
MNRTRRLTHAVLLASLFFLLPGRSGQAWQESPQEQQLIVVVRTGAPADKALACKQLAIHGTKEAVPALAPLLEDEHLASWARIALEAIPDPAADEALRNAAESLSGRLLIGTLNSIGVRRDANAVPLLTERLQNPDADVAAAAAVALGRIGDAAATAALQKALAERSTTAYNAVAEGCILCAERLMEDGKLPEAIAIYDAVRTADVPKPRAVEATRGAILARGTDGIPLLLEQLESDDRAYLYIGLTTARELPGAEVADALAAHLAKTSPSRAALVLYALADRRESSVPAAVLQVAKNGARPVRIAAIGFIGKKGDQRSLDTLLEIATESDQQFSQAAKLALAELSGEGVNEQIAQRLNTANGPTYPVLIELVGMRRIDATKPLIKALDHSDPAVRAAALTSLGATAGPQDLAVLISQVIQPKNDVDLPVAQLALREACVRMPDREACAAELGAAMPAASIPSQVQLLEILGAMGGQQALQSMAAAVKSGQEPLQDAGSRLLGEWMSVDAGPVLLDLTGDPSSDKYRIRLLRGYIRLARQFIMPDPERAEMCRQALKAATRADEQKLVLAVLERYPSLPTLQVAIQAAEQPALKNDAQQVAMIIVQKLGGDQANARKLLTQIGLEPMKVEIIKAEYGAGDKTRDVTEQLQQLAGDLPLIALSAANYNESFGGDPAPGTKKELKIEFRINGKPGRAIFAENALIMLPVPK